MERINQAEILDRISQRSPFAAMAEDRSFWIRVKSFEPRIGMAIHNGEQFRPSLRGICAMTSFERWQEEDPLTGSFVESLPIQVVAMDSRYEYDLNRDPSECIYSEAWGKSVWKTPLPEEERTLSIEKHNRFYEIVTALVAELEAAFGFSVVYDIHSYNWRLRSHEREAPTFNIGTDRVDRTRYAGLIDSWMTALKNVTLSCETVRVAENEVFLGHGYLLSYLTRKFDNTLVLATEIKKIYCEETTQIAFPDVVSDLEIGFSRAFRTHRHDMDRQRESQITPQVVV